MVNLYVDPRYGSDSFTVSYNYNPLKGALPAHFCGGTRAEHPLLAIDSLTQQPLVHAPFPFKTVTGAINYLKGGALLDPSLAVQNSTNGACPFLPTGGTFTSAYVIIHCLPGLYQNSTQVEPHNRLAGNGEVFPILLPNRVSIQGTSALNTVFEPVDGIGPVFEFGAADWNLGSACDPSLPEPADQTWSYIDSISISSAVHLDPDPSLNTPASQAGILVDAIAGHRVFLNVSNCFIYCNGVGVLADATQPSASGGVPPESERHRINLINNTFIWNLIGVWNGQLAAFASHVASKGFSHVSCINNIFDSSPPTSGDTDGTNATLLQLEVPFNQPTCVGATAKSLPRGMARWASLVKAATLKVIPIPGTTSFFYMKLPTINGMSNFEGLSEMNLFAVRSNGIAFECNAYESSRFDYSDLGTPGVPVPYASPAFDDNRATFFNGHLPSTGREFVSNQGGFFTPANNLTNYTRGTQWLSITQPQRQNLGIRGVYLVRDMLLYGAWDNTTPNNKPFRQSCEFDQSPTDFRLSPFTDSGYGALQIDGPLHSPPLFGQNAYIMDKGYPTPSETWPALMFNNGNPSVIHVTNRPLPSTPFGAGPWDHDCEGFGNPWVVPAYGNTAAIPDIGADEFDLNLVVGYRAGTTWFTTAVAAAGLPKIDNDFLWFVGEPAISAGAIAEFIVSQPSHMLWPAVSNYVASPLASSLYFPATVDTVPHLLPDVHPFWYYSFPAPFQHLFPTNWDWEPCSGNPYINRDLYVNPTAGIANPTGTFLLPSGYPDFSWLDKQDSTHVAQAPLTMWPQVPPTPPAVWLNTPLGCFGSFCQHLAEGDNPSPERPSHHPLMTTAPGSALHASLEFPLSGAPVGPTRVKRKSNLQSFTIFKQS